MISQLMEAPRLSNRSEDFEVAFARSLIERRPRNGARREQTAKGGLAPWQIRRLEVYIATNIARPIPVSELAALTRLSSSYFSRAFARTVGLPPHHMLNLYRVTRAAWLMGHTSDSLADIAQACGLCDQAHLTRLFRRFHGDSPASWRRSGVVWVDR